MFLFRLLVLFIITINVNNTKSLFGQNDSLSLSIDFERYNNLVLQEKFEESMEYVHDSFFKFYPKPILIESLIKSRSNSSVNIKTYMPTNTKFGTWFTFNLNKYVIIDYQVRTEFKILAISQELNLVVKYEKISRQFENYKKIFGSENVAYDSINQIYLINAKKRCVATLFKNSKNWKFIMIDNPKRLKLAETFIPKEILN